MITAFDDPWARRICNLALDLGFVHATGKLGDEFELFIIFGPTSQSAARQLGRLGIDVVECILVGSTELFDSLLSEVRVARIDRGKVAIWNFMVRR